MNTVLNATIGFSENLFLVIFAFLQSETIEYFSESVCVCVCVCVCVQKMLILPEVHTIYYQEGVFWR